MEGLHRKHGNIVRIAPDELSFATIQSFKDIYGPPSKSKKLFTKSELFYDHGSSPNIAYERDPDEHAAQYKLFAPAFRSQALRDQEHIVHEHTDLFVQKIQELSGESKSFNIAHAFEWLTFDIMGELTFGEPFGAVKEAKANYWVSILLDAIYGGSIGGLKNRIPILESILPWLIPTAALEQYAQHSALTLRKVKKRMEIGDSQQREDFFANVIRTGKMDERQIAANAGVFLTAGAETSATVLSAATYYLATHQDCYGKLKREVTEAFPSYAAITGDGAAALPYLNAVLEETMRIFPPSPVGPPRVSPGEYVDGVYVPKGIYVSTDIMSLHRDPQNAPEPHVWRPERWLGENAQKPYTVPFSIGPRACMGTNLAYLEMRIALAKIVHQLDWEIVGQPGDWPTSCKLTQLWKKSPLMVHYSRRRR